MTDRKQFEADVRKQIEYYFSDNNLKQDEFFYNTIKNSETGSISIDAILTCNKIKKLNATKDDITQAIAESTELELNGDGTGIKRKVARPLPEFEPKLQKKVKTDGGHAKPAAAVEESVSKEFDPKIFMITLSQANEALKWLDIQNEISKVYDVKINYTRLNGTEGHIAVDKNSVPQEKIEKLAHGSAKVGDIDIKVEECLDDNLKKFYVDHGRHLDMCMERAGLKKKSKKKDFERNDHIDFVFNNQRYNNLNPVKNIFKAIIQRTGDGDPVSETDHKALLELLKYHDSYEQKVRDLKHFTVGQHPSYKQTRCFFVVRNDGTQEDFSSTKCIENIKNKYQVSDEKTA